MMEWLVEWERSEVVELLRSSAYIVLALGSASLVLSSRANATPGNVRALAGLLIPVYFLLGANALLHGDELFLPWAREIFREQHWYGIRRVVQAGLLVLLGVWVASQMSRSSHLRSSRSEAVSSVYRLMYWGSLLSVGLAVLRFVSFHYSDAVLNARFGGFRVGGWVEGIGAALVAAAIAIAHYRRNRDV